MSFPFGPKEVFAVLKFCHELYARMQSVSENNDYCRSILQHIKDLQSTVENLKQLELEQDEWPKSCMEDIANFKTSLDICKHTCASLKSKSTFEKYINVGANETALKTLEKELQRASYSLQITLQLVSMGEIKSLKENVHRDIQEVKAAAIHPRDGVYLPNHKSSRPRPNEIKCLQVTLDEHGDLMVVKWSDNSNPKGTVDSYDIRYDDENEQVLSFPVEECRQSAGPNEFCVKIGPPKIKLGHHYTVTVRGINGTGPGKWSEEQLFRFKTGPPNKPKRPTVIILSPTEVLIRTKRPSKIDENGSAITHCKVEYTPNMDNDPTWNNHKSPIKQQSDVEVRIKSLIPDTTYYFRIRMINDSGESAPSDSVYIMTTQLIPGPPQELRISSKRTATRIKLRWEEPATNPQAAHEYKVEMCRKKKGEWKYHSTVNKKSAKITSLKTNTKYRFRVQTINNKGDPGEWSDPIEAETRHGAIVRVVGTVGAVIGGTVGGPVLGATSGGLGAVLVAGEGIDNKVGKVAAAAGAGTGGAVAGALLGTIGAPVYGGAMGFLAYGSMSGKFSNNSPQTSDDETEDLHDADKTDKMK